MKRKELKLMVEKVYSQNELLGTLYNVITKFLRYSQGNVLSRFSVDLRGLSSEDKNFQDLCTNIGCDFKLKPKKVPSPGRLKVIRLFVLKSVTPTTIS